MFFWYVNRSVNFWTIERFFERLNDWLIKKVITSSVLENSEFVEPDKYVLDLSNNKALSVSTKINSGIIVAADTIIYCNGKKYEKPKNKSEAIKNMKELRGKKSIAYTGITIMDLDKKKTVSRVDTTVVYLSLMSDKEVEWYVSNEENVYNCCGYVPLGKASLFIEKVEGDYNNLLGLSLKAVYDLFKNWVMI